MCDSKMTSCILYVDTLISASLNSFFTFTNKISIYVHRFLNFLFLKYILNRSGSALSNLIAILNIFATGDLNVTPDSCSEMDVY